MMNHTSWPWWESLGNAAADALGVLEVRRIAIGIVRDRCFELGLREGQRIVCRRRSRDLVTVELPGGEIRTLELAYAWFVQVRRVGTEPPTHSKPIPSRRPGDEGHGHCRVSRSKAIACSGASSSRLGYKPWRLKPIASASRSATDAPNRIAHVGEKARSTPRSNANSRSRSSLGRSSPSQPSTTTRGEK